MAYITGISDIQEEALRQFPLDAEVVGVNGGDLQMRVDRADTPDRRGRRHSTARRVGEIAVLILDLIGIGRQKSLGKDHVALRSVVVSSESAADSGLVVPEWPPRETEARHEKVRRVVETSLRSRGYGQRG